ncbi:DNA polymerase III subunit alpha [Candidatus Parcubacteria bacterium]|uniref:DNA polymerase III subunit alpha n=1 Tax=Candidatus Kaiserbacteria bacterium CG10_big_fil_rev_8_21_14_0_10_47_16 TaxID=1974608 RepID=A0A2H0UG89_9BACT|nr:DNA polymerase III subunit alpha [Candidatus Parcubacteria bacterium]PIR84815.1 MAG: DNA polymerase III subunit alpha [Candidatus Kaiserbacteria bacterium CG10_big_fil_rev_8_21_14_0_10_47_16]
MPKGDFVHLHVHSHYSLLSALPKPKELAARAKENGMHALALTDAGGLYGAIDFYKACTKEGVKPIIGVDAYLAPRTRLDKDAGIDKPRGRVILLAKTNEGYKNLIKIVTESYVNGFYYRPRIDHDLLKEFHNDLICIIPSFSGEPVLALKDGDDEKAGASLDWYRSVFGKDCYLEITHHPEILDHESLQKKIIDLAEKSGTPLVAAHDVYYLNKDDYLAREAMLKIQSGGVVESIEIDDEHEDFSFLTTEQIKELFADTPEAVANTVKIADECNVHMEPGKTWYFPNYIIESGREPDDELRFLAEKGALWRGMSLDDAVVKDRLNYELDIIKMKGYAKYFLVVGDLIREARERKILTTIRGSVAGSLTTYVLGITNVDPLEYNLPFERFLNPERPSAPDIDMDYADNRRDEIIAYAKEKYGEDRVAQIGTFGTMMARAAVRDVARALGQPYAVGDKIAKLIPMGSQGFPMTITRALEIEPDLAKEYKNDSDVRAVIDLAKKIEGRVRHVGVHAAGVVIAPEPLSEFVPVQPDSKTGKLITQYEMHSVGEDGVGLLKFDFLGIKNLAILADAVTRVKAIHNIDVDIENVPTDDQNTFDMLARGETMGLFQLNGSGMTAFLRQLKPTTIHDINAMVALYRPGPMESIPQYIERKHNANLITYLDPRLTKILDRSYGVVTYQDDVLMISRELAGYSWLEADMLRKAMGKKIPEVMEAERQKLLDGFRDHGKISPKVGEKLWKLIEPFAAYGFNKAHAASYGRVAYQTAYMKANYPAPYMSSVLTADSGDTEKISEIIHECERMGIEVLPPDINESFADFSVVPAKDGIEAKIRFGLTTVKNFGAGVAEAIITERKANGPYTSLSDFLTRVTDKNLNKKSLESLIKVGAFDRFAERGIMFGNLDTMLAYNKEHASGKESAQDSLFGGIADSTFHELSLNPTEPASSMEKLIWEKELLGIYVSGHPLDNFAAELKKRSSITDVRSDNRNGIPVVTAGIIETVKELLTKKGDRMAFIALADQKDSIEMVAFPETYHTYKELLIPGTCVAIKGRLSIRNDEPTIALEKVKRLSDGGD